MGILRRQVSLRWRLFLRALDRLSPNGRGIVAMLGAMAAFAMGDALMKLATEQLPAGQSIFIRGLIGATLIWGVAWRTGAVAQIRKLWNTHLPWRTLGDTGGSLFFISSLPHMPLADAAAIMQTNPLAVTAGAALFLGEHVGWRRWTATGIGFLGALLIIQPGASTFTWASVLVILSVLSCTLRDVATRGLAGIPTVLITATAATTTMLVSTAFSTFEQWQAPVPGDFVRLGAAAVCMLVGQILVVISIRAGDVSAVVPFRYSAMLWTLLLSAVVWQYVPNATTMAGIVIVSGAGLYTFFREQTLRRRAAAQAVVGGATQAATAKASTS
jgi:drug/metabolite transporter (DMT)-like permease